MDVRQKDIKNINLSVLPPAGRVRISAPLHMSLETIRAFALSKLGWIKQAQQKLQAQERETPRQYLDRESLYCWGTRYLLRIEERNGSAASVGSVVVAFFASSKRPTNKLPKYPERFGGSSNELLRWFNMKKQQRHTKKLCLWIQKTCRDGAILVRH